MTNRFAGIFAAILALTMAAGSAQAADAAKGKKVFNKCKACHTVKKGGKNRVGPNLFNVVGRKAAMVEKFKYSTAMKDSGVVWDDANLDAFIKKPKKFMKKTKMAFAGVKKDSQRADLIAYLKTFAE